MTGEAQHAAAAKEQGGAGEEWWRYDQLESGEPYDWGGAARGVSPWDNIDFHLDLGCGTVPKGRLGIDRHPAPGVDLAIDLEDLEPARRARKTDFDYSAPGDDAVGRARALYEVMEQEVPLFVGLPFPDNSIESIVSHHCLEHIRDNFITLMDECHRILVPGGVMRIIVPLFPSKTAVEDPDHKRYFMEESFNAFCGAPDGSHWHESFSVPYTTCRFEQVDHDITPRSDDPRDWWKDAREMRVALRKYDA